jgi:hypothetical protein
MNFSRIIKDSFRITIRHKFLWLLGLFIGGASFGSNAMSYSSNSDDFDMDKAKEMFHLPATSESALNFFTSKAQALSPVKTPPSIPELVTLGLIILFVVLIVLALIYVSVTAMGAIVLSVADLAAGKESNFKDAWGKGHRFFWRRLSFGLLLFIFVMLSIFVLALPTIIFGIAGLIIPAIIFGVLAFLIFIVGIIYLCLIVPVAERALFLNQHKPYEALKAGYKIFNANWSNFVILFLIIFGFNLAFAFAMMILLVVPGLIIFLIGYLFYLVTPVIGYIIGGLLALVLIAVLIVLSGAYQAFSSSVLTLGYLEAKK